MVNKKHLSKKKDLFEKPSISLPLIIDDVHTVKSNAASQEAELSTPKSDLRKSHLGCLILVE